MAGGALAATLAAEAARAQGTAAAERPAGALLVSPPVLQNAAETSMGVGFAVSALANGYVKLSRSPDMANARVIKCGGYRVTDMNDKVMLVRLTGLEPATTYYYQIGADRISYGGGYAMRVLGREEDPNVYSFTTLGVGAKASFCVISDTHRSWPAFQRLLDKIDVLLPSCVVWNGDAYSTAEDMETLVGTLYTPKVRQTDYASRRPYLFVPGNHESRGFAARHLERALMFRQPEERNSRDWDLGRNFAVRCGDIAMIGLDTGEDKRDDRDIFAGLFNMEPYREAQTVWLKDVLARPDIRSAPYLVAFCHIPLYDGDRTLNPGDLPNDGVGEGTYAHDFAIWQRACSRLWGPLLAEAGCQLVITGHQHRYRYDAPNAEHAWAQIVCGGPELGVSMKRRDGKRVEVPDPGLFPTVVEGRIADDTLTVSVHDVLGDRVADVFSFKPRRT